MRLNLATIPFGALLFSALLIACEQRPADPALPTIDVTWRTIQPFEWEPGTRSVWASALDDIYTGRRAGELHGDIAYVDEPHIDHFNGALWTRIALPIADENGKTSIWGSGPDDVYVAVDRLYHFDGTGWQRVSIDAQWVGGTSESNVFAASEQRVFHFNGVEWDTLLTTEKRYIKSASAAPDGSFWVAANDSLLVWNVSTWTSIPWINPYLPDNVVAISAGDAITWEVGGYFEGPVTRLYRWNGTTWQLEDTVPGRFTAAWTDGSGGLYAVGLEGLATRYDGVEWVPLPRPTAFDLYAVVGTGTGALVAAGAVGKVSAFDGTEWRTLREGKLRDARVIWAESPSRLLAGYYQEVFELDGDRWFETVLPTKTGVSVFGGRSLDDVYAILYDASVLHYNGQSWAVSADSLIGAQYSTWTSPSGTVYSTGYRSVYRCDGSWEALLDGDFEFNVITGDDAGHIVVAGEAGTSDAPVVKLFDEGVWRNLSAPQDEVHGAWIGSDDDLYLAGLRGFYRWDGVRFKRISPPRSGPFYYAFGTASRVIAIGRDATAVFDGALVNVVDVINPLPVTLATDGALVGAFGGGLAVWKP